MTNPKGDLAFRLSGDIVAKVDDWRRDQPVIPSKVDAVRTLIERGLATPAPVFTLHPQDKPAAVHKPAPAPSTEVPLSTATLQQTDNLTVVGSLTGDNGQSGDKSPEPRSRTAERAEEEAHQKLFGTGIATLIEVSKLDTNTAHDTVVNWVLKSSALHVLTLIEAVKEMGDVEPGAVAPLISSQVHSYKPIAGLSTAAESD